MQGLERDPVFTALTRPQMVLGVTYGLVVVNAVACAELFVLFKAFWVLGAAAVFHAFAWVACRDEPHIFDIWRVRAAKCRRSRAWRLWRCNAYRP